MTAPHVPPVSPHDTERPPALPDYTEQNLVALVGSRLCHDLISPLGAISNGVELMGLTGQNDGPEMQLIAESVAMANAKLRMFRIAFGRASAEQSLAEGEIRSLMQELSRGNRIGLAWQTEGPQPRPLVKAALLAMLCIEPALPRGGEITIRKLASGWQIRGQTQSTRLDLSLWSLLESPFAQRADLLPAQVQFLLLPRAAREANLDLTWQADDGSVSLHLAPN